MKHKHKAMRPLTHRKCLSRARKCVRILLTMTPDNPAWKAMVDEALKWKGLAMDKATTNEEIADASQI